MNFTKSDFPDDPPSEITTATYTYAYSDLVEAPAKKEPPCKHNWRNKWKNPKKREQYCTKCPATRF